MNCTVFGFLGWYFASIFFVIALVLYIREMKRRSPVRTALKKIKK